MAVCISSTNSDVARDSARKSRRSSITAAGSRARVDPPAQRGRRRLRGHPADLVLGLVDLGVRRVERSTSWTMTQTLPASLWSTRPRTITICVGARARSSAAAIAFSKTRSSTWPSRSSSVANIIVEPDAGADLLGPGDHAADLHPLAVAAVHDLGARAVGLDPQRLAHALERVLGDEEADRLLLDRQQLRALELLVGIGGCDGAANGGVGRAVAAEAAEVEDRALADLRVLLRLLAGGLRGLEHRRACPCASRRSSRTRRT